MRLSVQTSFLILASLPTLQTALGAPVDGPDVIGASAGRPTIIEPSPTPGEKIHPIESISGPHVGQPILGQSPVIVYATAARTTAPATTAAATTAAGPINPAAILSAFDAFGLV